MEFVALKNVTKKKQVLRRFTLEVLLPYQICFILRDGTVKFIDYLKGEYKLNTNLELRKVPRHQPFFDRLSEITLTRT